MVRQVEEICREDEPSLFSGWNLEILLQREVEVVNTRVSDIRKETRGVAKGLSNVTAGVWGEGDQPRPRTCPREIECLVIEPKVGAALGARDRCWVTDQIRTISYQPSAVAEPIRVIGNSERSTSLNRINGGDSPAT